MPDKAKLALIRDIVHQTERITPSCVNVDNPFFGLYISIKAILAFEEQEEAK